MYLNEVVLFGDIAFSYINLSQTMRNSSSSSISVHNSSGTFSMV
jgi:hypothetical protein